MRALNIAISLVLLITLTRAAVSFANASMGKKQKLIFVINTTERDAHGFGSTPAYLNEQHWIQSWSKIGPGATVVRIRANSNADIVRQLSMWMQPAPDEKEVVGLAIYSHGSVMHLANESQNFSMALPADIATVLSPIVGRFSEGSRILFAGCNVVDKPTVATTLQALNSIASALGVKNGLIYANATPGSDLMKLYSTHPFNPDIKLPDRIVTVGLYATWPISIPFFAATGYFLTNQGYILEKQPNGMSRLFKSRAAAILEPTMRVLEGATPVEIEQPRLTIDRPAVSKESIRIQKTSR